MPYTNPVIPGFYPDPSLCRVDEDYYLVTSSFEYFPGVPIFHSRDLVHWWQIGHCLTRPSQLPLAHTQRSEGIWAPTLRYHDGVFYMVTTNTWGLGHFLVAATDPAGPWSEPLWLKTDPGGKPSDTPWIGGEGWDPSLFFDDDGSVYFTWYVHPAGIKQSLIDLATGELLTSPRILWTGSGGKSPEGPHLYKISGLYYLLTAEGGTEYGHMVTIARSESPWGPFESCPRNPILSHRSLDNPIQGTGHGDLVQDHRGNWWLAFLAFRPHGYPPVYHLGRETYLAPVRWDDEGWPVVGMNGRVEIEMQVETFPPDPCPPDPPRDDFDAPALRFCWNYLRNPDERAYSLSDRPGWLRLRGSALTLDDPGSPTWLGRRQQHFDCRASALLDFDPQDDGEEAGLVAWQNERHHYEIAIVRENGQRQVIARQRIANLQAIVARHPAPPGPLILAIEAETETYRFAFAPPGQPLQVLARGETRYLSTEVGGLFTGVYLAMYATGNGRPATTPADFDWFEYQSQ